MDTFDLEGSEYIELNKLLKICHLVGSGGEANMLISSGLIRVNKQTETRKRMKLRAGDVIEYEEKQIHIK